MLRRLLCAVSTGLLALALAACGEGGDGPVTTPPPDLGLGSDDGGAADGAASDGGGAATAEAPDIPAPDPADFAGMDDNTPEGAEQAFRYYIATLMWARQTGDSSGLEELSGAECDECAEIIGEVEDDTTDGETWSRTTLTDQGSKVYESENYDHEIGYIYLVGEHTEPAGSGDSEAVAEQAYTAIAGLGWRENRWFVDGLSIESTEAEI